VIRYVEADPYAAFRGDDRVARDPCGNDPLGFPHRVSEPQAGRDDVDNGVRRVRVYMVKKPPRERNRADMQRQDLDCPKKKKP
jgi:hypothetical protein